MDEKIYSKPSKVKWIEQEHKGQTERFAVRRGWDGWRVIYPSKKEDGSICWKNVIGSWQRWIKSIIFLLLLLAAFSIYNHDTSICREYVANHSAYFDNMTAAQEEREAAQQNISLDDLNVTAAQGVYLVRSVTK